MNLGRGFPVPQEKQIIQNGDFWTPVTPGKPVVERRPNYPQAEMQQNQIEPENWQDLLGIYTGVLQDELLNGQPKRSNVDGNPGPSYREQNLQDVAPLVTRNTLQQNFNASAVVQNHREPSTRYGVAPNFLQNRVMEQNLQDVAPLVTRSTLSQNFNGNGLREQNHRESSSRYAVVSPNFHQNQVISSNFLQNGAISPNVQQNRVISSNFLQNGAISPNVQQSRVISSNFLQNGASSPNVQQSRVISSNFLQNGAISPNVHQNRAISSNFHQNGAVSPNFHQNMAIPSNFQQNGPISSNFQRNRTMLPNLHQDGVVSPNSNNNRVLLPASVENNNGNAVPAGSMNQNAGGNGSYMPNSGKAIVPQKVHSLAELLGSRNSSPHAALRNVEPSSSTYIAEKHKGVHPVSQGRETNQGTHNSGDVLLQQNHFMQANYNRPQATSTVRPPAPSRPSYNLNFPPGSEDGEPSSSAINLLNQLWPATPDQQKQSNNYHARQEPVLQVDEIPNQQKDLQSDGIFSKQPEIVEISSNGFVQNTLGASSNSTPSKEINNLDGGGNEAGIDLNKTPAGKTPKRKKHRPKVIVEGKAKKTPKATPTKTPKSSAVATNKTPASNTPEGTPRVKRKYVRRKGIETPTTPSTDEAKKGEVSKETPVPKSCKRSLNFDAEDKVERGSEHREFEYQAQNSEVNKVPIDLNVASNTECPPGFEPLMEGRHHASNGKEKQQTDSLYNSVSAEHIPPEESVAFKYQPSAPKNHALNVIARSLSFRNPNQSGGEHRHNLIHHRLGGGLSQIVMQASSSGPDLDGRSQRMLHPDTQIPEISANTTEKQGSQRNNLHSEMVPSQSVVLMGSQLWSNRLSNMGEHTGSTVHTNCLDSFKRSRIEDRSHGTSSVVISDIGDCSGLTQNRGKQGFQGQSSRLYSSSNTEANKVNYNAHINSANSRYGSQHQGASSSQVQQQLTERLVQKISSQFSTNMQNAVPITTISNFNKESTSGRDPKYVQGNGVLSPVSVPAQRQTEQPSQNAIVIVDTASQKETKALQIYGHSSKKAKGSRGKKKVFTVDDIADFLRDLSINNTGKETVRGQKNALVPYKGTSGAIIPFEEFKRRVPRPRVDLDPETNRLWNLLMGKEGAETSEEMDANKQKWWDDERSIFKGRVESFIARMHQVQGDRRFSKWKGSVVDSVIGVFLTQNVSDHLSSSAFMSLAAKFPIKSRASEPACQQNGRSSSDEQNKVRVTFPDEPSYDRGTSRETMGIYSSVTSDGSARAENGMTGTRTHFVTDNFRIEEDIFSSQSSSESFIYQVSEEIRSSSGSNSEADDQLLGRNFNLNYSPINNLAEQAKTTAPYLQQQFQVMGSSSPDKRPLVDHQPSEKSLYGQYLGVASGRDVSSHPSTSDGLLHKSTVTPSSGSWLSMLTGPDRWDGDSLDFLGKESTSSLASADFGSFTGVAIEPEHDKADECAETSYTAQEAGKPKPQSSLAHRGLGNTYIGQQADPSAVSQGINVQNSAKASQKESFLADTVRPGEASSAQPSPRQSVGATPGPKEMGKVESSGGPAIKTSPATPNAKKRKEKEKAEPINWDTLREDVHRKNGPPTGVNENAMDSLDYEALRNADVKEISDAIKERGMNNMLAERIKDFLNRLVRDHGKVDLEWLRDVPADKSKDYLLSIRGLGLKSVECVRLLTLHHLAFPVDTNVGRIAVRLGWVPLQPLPESLQLHLLEMYPVLESIQKYLWPRLCKLDQETLYELHYQMITFGKVFCTKREPNCNACPLRAECRHFASAFASARLSLPGPEEKRIVTSADPTGARAGPEVTVRPVRLLPPGGSNVEGEMGFAKTCEPIIEEPKTPEAPTEAWERDIEDAFFEDPDEIPVIKLNLKEFTSNLQSFMQEHMEMQEGDMSRALVALSPELASIPMPKLKHVSRLRTEHQVYELPDSHPLLKGMDRREPDDPSPYLLAIWTPGETADSIQPPESKCSSLDGGPCNLSTCFSCNSIREANAQTVRGTILIPCRTAMRGSFPLNGTYFQVNELFADHESSLNPIDVPRGLVWPLERRTVYFGTSVTTIFKGLPVQQIQQAFWRGFVCVRGFDRKSRSPKPLKARLHFPASKVAEQNKQKKGNAAGKGNAGKGDAARRE